MIKSFDVQILLLHCIHQVEEGGLTMCCDGFNVVDQLKKRSPDAFKILSHYPIQFRDAADDYVGHNIDAMQKPISLDSVGNIIAIRHNNGVRGSRFPNELMGQLYEWYDAYYKFSNLMYDPEFLVQFKLQPGQIVVFDNTRILHGRSGFNMGEGVRRYLEEVYLDWDEARSKARVLMGHIV